MSMMAIWMMVYRNLPPAPFGSSALSFLIVVGTVLIAESFDVHVPKGYVYFAMAFSLGVEAINIRMRTAMARKRGKEQDAVKLRKDIPGQ